VPIVIRQDIAENVMPIRVTLVDVASGQGARFRRPLGLSDVHEAAFELVEGPSRILLTVEFPRMKRILTLGATVEGLSEVAIRQSDDSRAEIDLHHAAWLGQCTVTCEASGKSKTGHHPCITCSTGVVTVRLCC
jgi:hypothetical protein